MRDNGEETYGFRLRRLESELEDLKAAQSRLMLAIVAGAITIAVFGLGIAVTLLVGRAGP